VPVHVTIALVAAKGQDVEPLSEDHMLDCPADAINPPLEFQVLRLTEASDNCLHVPTRAHKRVPTQGRISIQRCKDVRVLVDHRRHAAVGWIAISDGADETRTFARAALIVGRIEWRALVAHVSDNDLAPYSRHGASANAAARLGPERAADAREGETEFVYLPYSEAAGERIRPWTVGSDMGERAIDPAYLFERYGTEQRLRIRIEAH
jgi:hypothetical protein